MPSAIPYSKDYAQCAECTTLTKVGDIQNGMCPPCYTAYQTKCEFIMARADDKALADVSRKVLAGLTDSKGEPTSPQIFDAAVAELGGVNEFGKMLARSRRRASGDDLTPEEVDNGARSSPTLAFKYDELLTRLSLKNDEREEIEIANLSDDELLNTLKGLVLEVAKDSEDFRKVLLNAVLDKQPDLIHEAMNMADIPLLEAKAEEVTAEDVADIGIDEKWED